MVLARYFFKHFFKYFLLLNTGITFLFNFIEFFEKIVRAKHATMASILHFVVLNAPYSFFDNFALSTWLATGLFIKELLQHNEWETLQILNINPQKLFRLFLTISITLVTFSIVGKEFLTLRMANKAEKFKLEKLKQHSQQKITNRWMILPTNNNQNIFCFFQFLDLTTNTGNGLILIYINGDFEIEKTVNSATFTLAPQTTHLVANNATTIEAERGTQAKNKNLEISIPGFFSQLELGLEIPTLAMIAKNLIYANKMLPEPVLNTLLSTLIKRIIFHVQVFLYPLLTLCLFLLFPAHSVYKLSITLLSYPLFTACDHCTNFIVQQGFSAWFLFLPYLLIIFFIFFLRKSLKKLVNRIQ